MALDTLICTGRRDVGIRRVFFDHPIRDTPGLLANPALNLAPFGRWTLRVPAAAQRWLAPSWTSLGR